METIQTIFTSDIFRIIVKLLLALVLTGSIGLERSIMNKPAGFGTHAIIGVSACLMVIGVWNPDIFFMKWKLVLFE